MPAVAVNDTAIDHATIAREVQNHQAPSPDLAWREATRALVIRELLLQRARALEIEPAPLASDGARETDEESLIRLLLEREVVTPKADEAVCRRYYDRNAARFRTPDLFAPAHILFKARRDEPVSYARAEARAETVLAELRDQPERFDSLARSLSDCPSAGEGGRLGQIVPGETTPEFEAALAAMQPGEICAEPVRTRYGVHVLRLDQRIAGRQMPFEQVRARIAAYLEERSWRRAVAQYITLLAGQARIEGFDLPGAGTPLVQ
jgi:peptidyl-prolyl cis-trans isomerase C